MKPKKIDSIIEQELEGALYQIVQELVTNVVRQAKATRAEITLRYAGGKITLVVQDNGLCGRFAGPKKGYGLRDICERTEAFGGEVEVQPVPRKGPL